MVRWYIKSNDILKHWDIRVEQQSWFNNAIDSEFNIRLSSPY